MNGLRKLFRRLLRWFSNKNCFVLVGENTFLFLMFCFETYFYSSNRLRNHVSRKMWGYQHKRRHRGGDRQINVLYEISTKMYYTFGVTKFYDQLFAFPYFIVYLHLQARKRG
jgi:hypothetical protein